MRILVLSFYYQPDLSAGSFRVTSLVEALSAQVPAGARIDVISTVPNRYSSFTASAPESEQNGNVFIRRIPLPAHRSGMLDQSRAYLAYARAVLDHVRGVRYDIVACTSGRLMSAVLASRIARQVGAPLYLDIRDIFVDTIREVASKPVALSVVPFFSVLERWAIRRASIVNLVSEGFADYFRSRYPRQRFTFLTNGIDDEFRFVAGGAARAPGAPLKIVYAGNMGEGQGLESIVPALAARMGDTASFRLIGDGGRRGALEQALARSGARNVELVSPVQRARLLEEYRAADVLFLHLNDYEAFKKVLPSKLFEYAALGKPIWAGVGGYAARFVNEEIDNAVVFRPCDVDDALHAFSRLTLVDRPRERFVAKYMRSAISRRLADDILSLGGGR